MHYLHELEGLAESLSDLAGMVTFNTQSLALHHTSIAFLVNMWQLFLQIVSELDYITLDTLDVGVNGLASDGSVDWKVTKG